MVLLRAKDVHYGKGTDNDKLMGVAFYEYMS